MNVGIGAALLLGVVILGASAGGCGGPASPSVASVECRDDSSCGNGRACKAGRCEAKPASSDGPSADALVSRPLVECGDEQPCKGPGERCQNGHCVGPELGGPGCRDFGSPAFEFDSLELTVATRDTLQRLAKCVVSGSLKGRKVVLTGHCDPRGENEYNMGLGAQRSASAKDFLMSLGVPTEQVIASSRGKLDAVGTEESSWVKDRRIDIEVR